MPPAVVPLVPATNELLLLTGEDVKATPPEPPPPGPWGSPLPVLEPPLPPLARMVTPVRAFAAVLFDTSSTEPPAPPPPEPSFRATNFMSAPLTSMVPVPLTLDARTITMPPPEAPELAKPPVPTLLPAMPPTLLLPALPVSTVPLLVVPAPPPPPMMRREGAAWVKGAPPKPP